MKKLREKIVFRDEDIKVTIIMGFDEKWRFTKKIISDYGYETRWATCRWVLKEEDRARAKEILEEWRDEYLEKMKKKANIY